MKRKKSKLNPIEAARLRAEERLEAAAEREERTQEKPVVKQEPLTRAEEEEKLRLEMQYKAEVVKRRNAGLQGSSVSLSALLFEVVEFLRSTRRPATQAQLSKEIRYDLNYNERLLSLIRNNSRVQFEGGLYTFLPPYPDVHSLADMEALVERSPFGVVASDLEESYKDAKRDIKLLKKSERCLFVPNSERKSDVIFPLSQEFEMQVDDQLRAAWHQANVLDISTLGQKMVELGLPFEKSTAKLPRRLKRKKVGRSSGPRRAVDRYNHHVPEEYRDDSEWQERLRRQAK